MLAVKLLQIQTIKDQVIGFEQVGISKGILEREEKRWDLELNIRCQVWWRMLVPLGQWRVLIGDRGWEEGGVVPSVQWLAWARAVGCSCGRTALLLEQPGLSIVCRTCSLRPLYNPLRFLCSQPSHLQIAFLKTQILLILPYCLSLAVTQFDKYSSSSQPLHPHDHRLTPSWPPFLPDELTLSLW